MAYSRAEWNRLPVFLGAFLEIARFPALPVDFLFLLMDVPGVLDASTSPPVFAEARLRRAPPDRRHWLLPSFDTFRLEAAAWRRGARRQRERSGAFWRGTVHAFTGYSVEEMVARRAYVHNLASRLDGGDVVGAGEPVAASLQFSGGEGNARRWAVTTACDAGDDRLDVAAAEVAVEVEASGARTEPSPATAAPAARRRDADGPTGITLRNYGFADHGDVCAKEAFLYLDGISTSNGLTRSSRPARRSGRTGTRSRASRIVADPGAARVLLDWVGGAYGGGSGGGPKIYGQRRSGRGACAPVAAAFQNPRTCARGPRLPEEVRAPRLPRRRRRPARRRWGLGVEGSGFHSAASAAAPRRARVGALRVLAAVKGRCWARADAADAAVVASATVRAPAQRFGYLAAVAKRQRSYSDDAPAPRTAAQDVYAALRPCADLDCGGGLADLGAAAGPARGSRRTQPRCKVAGDDGAAARTRAGRPAAARRSREG
ncbi:hypothetical protein JL720_17127 [Aureococcus anophagefferens]|nr:hypothetical protein JL720_17127 [Aureococcus anophagefferens]